MACKPRETVREHWAHGGGIGDLPRDELHDIQLHQLADDLNAEFERRSFHGRAESFRQELPGAVAAITRVVADNPGQFALITAGAMVATRAAFSLVKPRTALEVLALAVVLQVGLPVLATTAVERGWLKFRTRDAAGCLVPLVVTRDPRPV
jgi:hypothetical protein